MECFYRKNRYKKGGYLIRLTRGYTDGGMDSRPDKTDFIFISRIARLHGKEPASG